MDRIKYSVIKIMKSAEEAKVKYCYSAKGFQEELNNKYLGHKLKAVYVELDGYLSSDHNGTNRIDLSCEGGGCIVVFDNGILDLGIHAEGQFNYCFLQFDEVNMHHTKDYPPNDYDEMQDCYLNIMDHDITVDVTDKIITSIDVAGTDMWCFPLVDFDEEKASKAKSNNDLPLEIDLTTDSFTIRIIGDDLEYYKLLIEEK